jgi:DNA-binding response OmpR family regulator
MAKILIVDDDPAMRRTIMRMIESEGHEILNAQNGIEGMRAVLSERPDIVITDILMPDKEGIETILELRREAPNTRIIAISGAAGGNGAPSYLKLAHELGADEVLAKPFVAADLLRLIHNLLGKPTY